MYILLSAALDSSGLCSKSTCGISTPIILNLSGSTVARQFAMARFACTYCLLLKISNKSTYLKSSMNQGQVAYDQSMPLLG